MKKIPFLLVYLRLLIAFIIFGLTIYKVSELEVTIVVLTIFGLLSDVFDGIIARKLNVATDQLRIWDSNVDLVFWISVIFSAFYLNPVFLKGNLLPIISVISLEVLAYIICFFKFKKTIATHSYLAKIWSITLFIFLIDLLLNSSSFIAFYSCIILGIISRIEIIGIILTLKKWTIDVKSIFSLLKHATN
jgi:CDP-diacylglycerol--glycerol-3-phosphate 3-phosphatidyltransferase